MNKPLNHPAILSAVLLCIAASTACSYSGSVKSTLAFTVPGQQVNDNQQSDRRQRTADRFAGGL